jgi:hypothetical protein
MNILITGIGGPTPRSIAKTIRTYNENNKIIGADSQHKALGFFMDGLVDKTYILPRADDPGYWEAVKELISTEAIDLAFVQPETEVIQWAKYYEENGNYPVPVLIPPLSLSESLVDKSIMSDLFEGTAYIPKTLKITQENPKFSSVGKEVGYPNWIRATTGSGGLGSLKIEDEDSLRSWLFINPDIKEFTISEFLPGRHLANQMLYINGEYVKGAMLECVEYVMASIVPSKVTGNTSYGRFLNEDNVLDFCHESVEYICRQLNIKPHGVLSFDLKEDSNGLPKITEINVRHMAYTGIMASIGFDLIKDTIELLDSGSESIIREPYYHFDKPYAFLRDVDIEPIIVDDKFLKKENA